MPLQIKSTLDHIQYKKTRAHPRYITKKSKTDSWQKYTNSININTSSSEVWNKIKAINSISYHCLHSEFQLNNHNTPLSIPSNITEAFIQIPFQNSLDIIFDNKWKWIIYLKQLKNVCKTKMNIIKTYAHHTSWRPKNEITQITLTELINIH